MMKKTKKEKKTKNMKQRKRKKIPILLLFPLQQRRNVADRQSPG
jgi:hypothetical protein